MKRLYTLVSILAVGSCLFAQPVVLTLKTHGLAPDQANEMKMSNFSDPGRAGENQVWDLSGMGSDKDFQSFVAPVSEAYKQLNFPEANVVLNEEGNLFFYFTDEEAQSAWGVINQCGRVVMKFSRPLTNMKYPFTYGDEFSGIYEGTYYFPDREAPLAGTYNVKADGYGKLILPGGKEINNILRVVFTHSYEVIMENSIETNDIVSYRWYSSSERFPLAMIIGIGNSSYNEGKYSYRSLYRVPEQIEELNQNIQEPEQDIVEESIPEPLQDPVRIYPNPANKRFTLEYSVNEDSEVFIELYDNKGTKVATLTDQYKKAGNYSETFNTNKYSLKHGIYHIRTIIGEQSYSTTFIRE
ncbi:MAG: hypothetical protein AMS27_12370 [Bacteroides sp. SM23_62_1]|nr:MAG: hypothetical protein AMS27_12370 [Bacteroides sp. SM23_62_1]